MSGVGPLMGDISWMALKSNGFVLELGVFSGEGSTTAIQEGLRYYALANQESQFYKRPLHISVDWDGRNLIANRPDKDWWRLIEGDTRDPASLYVAQGLSDFYRPNSSKAGLIFIDTLHDYDQMKAELELWQGIADDETVWLMHDTWMYGVKNEGMVKAIEEFAKEYGWRYEDYRQDSHGLGRMRR